MDKDRNLQPGPLLLASRHLRRTLGTQCTYYQNWADKGQGGKAREAPQFQKFPILEECV